MYKYLLSLFIACFLWVGIGNAGCWMFKAGYDDSGGHCDYADNCPHPINLYMTMGNWYGNKLEITKLTACCFEWDSVCRQACHDYPDAWSYCPCPIEWPISDDFMSYYQELPGSIRYVNIFRQLNPTKIEYLHFVTTNGGPYYDYTPVVYEWNGSQWVKTSTQDPGEAKLSYYGGTCP